MKTVGYRVLNDKGQLMAKHLFADKPGGTLGEHLQELVTREDAEARVVALRQQLLEAEAIQRYWRSEATRSDQVFSDMVRQMKWATIAIAHDMPAGVVRTYSHRDTVVAMLDRQRGMSRFKRAWLTLLRG